MKTMLAVLLLLPTAALAIGCKIEKVEELSLDLDGVTTLVVEMGSDTLHLDGAADADGVAKGRACASSDARMELLALKQEKHGDRLTLSLARDRGPRLHVFFGSDYAYHDIRVKIPTSLAVELRMGSGDVFVNDVAALKAELGSGDLDVKRIAGEFAVRVGSGDVNAESVGTLAIPSLGSGDVTANGVAGDVHIGSVGSGDVAVRDTQGAAHIGSLGSGDIVLNTVAGDVTLDRMGSGDLRVTDIGGDVEIKHSGSGDLHSRNVKGEIIKPRS